jgi:hypothetical protein
MRDEVEQIGQALEELSGVGLVREIQRSRKHDEEHDDGDAGIDAPPGDLLPVVPHDQGAAGAEFPVMGCADVGQALGLSVQNGGALRTPPFV